MNSDPRATPGSELFPGVLNASPGQADAPSSVRDTTTASFAADVIQESRNQPVLVDFWAPWCGPCKQLAPALERAVAAAKGRVKLVKMNIDEHPSIAGQLGIQSIPAVIAFSNGQPVDGFMGAVPESQIAQFIEKIAGDGGAGQEIENALAGAVEAKARGDHQQAAQIYAAILQHEADNVTAAAGLAEIFAEAGEADQARQVLDALPPEKASDPAVAAVRTRLELAEQVAELGDPAALQARLAADPADHEARFDLALIQNARGERQEAAENLLAIVKADRAWREDGAKAQLLKFFEAWGPADPATLSARRRLSSMLFS